MDNRHSAVGNQWETEDSIAARLFPTDCLTAPLTCRLPTSFTVPAPVGVPPPLPLPLWYPVKQGRQTSKTPVIKSQTPK